MKKHLPVVQMFENVQPSMSMLLIVEVETAIKNVTIDELDANEPIYNILGNRVSKGYKGICIQGGRKFIVK